MSKQMCWLAIGGMQTEKILHLRIAANAPWQPYTAFPQYAVPDHQIPHGSKGWATYQKLLRSGWTLVPTTQATAPTEQTTLIRS